MKKIKGISLVGQDEDGCIDNTDPVKFAVVFSYTSGERKTQLVSLDYQAILVEFNKITGTPVRNVYWEHQQMLRKNAAKPRLVIQLDGGLVVGVLSDGAPLVDVFIQDFDVEGTQFADKIRKTPDGEEYLCWQENVGVNAHLIEEITHGL